MADARVKKLISEYLIKEAPGPRTFLDQLLANPRGDGNSPLKYVADRGEIRNQQAPVTFESRVAQGVFDGSPIGLPAAGYAAGGLLASIALNAADGDGGAALEDAAYMAIFAGPGARNANLQQLARAKQMAKKGVDRNKIWRETGCQALDNFPFTVR